MNIRKPSNYSSLYSALDVLMGSDLIPGAAEKAADDSKEALAAAKAAKEAREERQRNFGNHLNLSKLKIEWVKNLGED